MCVYVCVCMCVYVCVCVCVCVCVEYSVVNNNSKFVHINYTAITPYFLTGHEYGIGYLS